MDEAIPVGDEVDPVIVDNGGSGRVAQKNQPLPGLLGNAHIDYASGKFLGGSIDYKPKGTSVSIPNTATSVVASYSGGLATYVSVAYHAGTGRWRVQIDSAADDVQDSGIFNQSMYQFDFAKHLRIDTVFVDGSPKPTPNTAKKVTVTLNFLVPTARARRGTRRSRGSRRG